MERRGFIRSLAVATVPVGLAGCARRNGSADESVLGAVVVANLDDEAHAVEFRVEWDGEVVHESTHRLEERSGRNGASPDRTWPDDPGQFVVSARLRGEEWRSADPADAGYPDCFGVIVEVSGPGRLGMFTSHDEYECSEEAMESRRGTDV